MGMFLNLILTYSLENRPGVVFSAFERHYLPKNDTKVNPFTIYLGKDESDSLSDTIRTKNNSIYNNSIYKDLNNNSIYKDLNNNSIYKNNYNNSFSNNRNDVLSEIIREKELKDDKKENSPLKKTLKMIKEFYEELTMVRILLFLFVSIIFMIIGYQIRKGEENSNYVRVPASE